MEQYTEQNPYKETRKVKNIRFSEGKNSDDVYVYMDFDCGESWYLCLEQYKKMGKPVYGDQIKIRMFPE